MPNYDGAAAAQAAGPATTPNYSGAASAAGLPQPGPQAQPQNPMQRRRPPPWMMGPGMGGWGGQPQLGGWGGGQQLGRFGGQMPQNPQFTPYQPNPATEGAATVGPQRPSPQQPPGRIPPVNPITPSTSPWQLPWMGRGGQIQPWFGEGGIPQGGQGAPPPYQPNAQPWMGGSIGAGF